MPDGIGCSHSGRVTRPAGRASGRPPGPPFSPAELTVLPAVLVELLHAARRPLAPDRANAAPPVRARNSRRVAARERRSFGCMGSPILTDWPVNSTYCNDLDDRVKDGGHAYDEVSDAIVSARLNQSGRRRSRFQARYLAFVQRDRYEYRHGADEEPERAAATAARGRGPRHHRPRRCRSAAEGHRGGGRSHPRGGALLLPGRRPAAGRGAPHRG